MPIRRTRGRLQLARRNTQNQSLGHDSKASPLHFFWPGRPAAAGPFKPTVRWHVGQGPILGSHSDCGNPSGGPLARCGRRSSCRASCRCRRRCGVCSAAFRSSLTDRILDRRHDGECADGLAAVRVRTCVAISSDRNARAIPFREWSQVRCSLELVASTEHSLVSWHSLCDPDNRGLTGSAYGPSQKWAGRRRQSPEVLPV